MVARARGIVEQFITVPRSDGVGSVTVGFAERTNCSCGIGKWHDHSQQALAADAEGLHETLNSNEELREISVPLVPTRDLWVTVRVEMIREDTWAVEFKDAVPADSTAFLGVLGYGEGRSTLRMLCNQWLRNTWRDDIKCKSATHGFKAIRAEANDDPSFQFAHKWSLLWIGACAVCLHSIEDDEDLVPDAGTNNRRRPWG